MTETPPILTNRPQFTAEHWAKAPRATRVGHIERVTHVDDDWVEIALKEGVRFRRRRAEIKQLLTANLEVHVEFVNGKLVTGLFVPNLGWAFRMSNEDLAQYTKELSVAVHREQMKTRDAIETLVAEDMTEYLRMRGVSDGLIEEIDVIQLARVSILAMGKKLNDG